MPNFLNQNSGAIMVILAMLTLGGAGIGWVINEINGVRDEITDVRGEVTDVRGEITDVRKDLADTERRLTEKSRLRTPESPKSSSRWHRWKPGLTPCWTPSPTTPIPMTA